MGKQGPCYHCRVTSTPLWRNGPPEKPVLCNACGSRWRTKGTLVNYTPIHARADENEDHQKVQRIKTNQTKMLKRKAIQDNLVPVLNKVVVEEVASNRSSSGSAISNPESSAQFSSVDWSEFTGSILRFKQQFEDSSLVSQSNTWEKTVPCKRRTCVSRPKSSSVAKLTKDLYNILQEQQSSDEIYEEDILFRNEMSVEIGHGSVLMRNPHQEESEASSISSVEIRAEKGSDFFVGGTKSQTERVHVLERHSSPLCSIDLKEGEKETGDSVTTTSSVPKSIVTICENQTQIKSESRGLMRSPKSVMNMNLSHVSKAPKSLASVFGQEGGSAMFGNSSSDEDLLMDLPSNGLFSEAELLHQL